MKHPVTGRVLLKYDFQIEKAAQSGDNDLAMNLVHDQRDYYEYFGLGTFEERVEYWSRKAVAE